MIINKNIRRDQQRRRMLSGPFDNAARKRIPMSDLGITYPVFDDEEDDRVPLWLITFTDIMALMLTFFVLLYSMAVPDENKWSDIAESVEQGVTQVKAQRYSAGQTQQIAIEKIMVDRGLDLNYLTNLLKSQMKETPLLQDALLFRGKGEVIISLPSDIVFDSGSAEVNIETRKALFALGGILHRVQNRIEVAGHSDPNPVGTNVFMNNWDLSLARASNVAALLSKAGYSREIDLRGLSNARYGDLSDKIPTALRESMSRRVDIIIMNGR